MHWYMIFGGKNDIGVPIPIFSMSKKKKISNASSCIGINICSFFPHQI